MVRCEWSESSAFEDGKVYPLAEFDRLMRKADEDFVSGRENIEQKYGHWKMLSMPDMKKHTSMPVTVKPSLRFCCGWQNIHRASGYW